MHQTYYLRLLLTADVSEINTRVLVHLYCKGSSTPSGITLPKTRGKAFSH